MLTNSIEAVISDGVFDIGTERAEKARSIAHKLLKWIGNNKGPATVFANKLINEIGKCCTHP